MKALILAAIALGFPLAAQAQLNPNIILQGRPVQIGNPMDSAIQAQQIRQLENQNRKMEQDVWSAREPDAKAEEDLGDSAKVTVSFPNHEEKVFRFNKSDRGQLLDLNSKKSLCGVSFGEGIHGTKYVELQCSAKAAILPIIATRAACISGAGPSLLLLTESKSAGYSFLIECGA